MSSRSLSKDPVLLGFVILTVSLLIQTFHAGEHVAQMLQKYVWHQSQFPGLLGAWFDIEWVHFLYNLALLVALMATIVLYNRNPGVWRSSALAVTALTFVTWFQGYHVLEHSVRLLQFLDGMKAPTPGILGRLFPVLEYHFLLNGVVSTLMLVAYLGFQPWREIVSGRWQESRT